MWVPVGARAGHSIGNAQTQFLPHAIEWVWRGYALQKSE
jgi:enterochelin esterase family protein